MDIVLYILKNSHGNVCSEVLSKVVSCQHEICWLFQIKVFSRFSEQSFLEVIYRSSCSLINAVMKYLNFCTSRSKFEGVTCKFTKNCTPSKVYSKWFLQKWRMPISKNAFWWLFLRATLFWKYSLIAASQGQLQRYFYQF